jgi:hypothetical protein
MKTFLFGVLASLVLPLVPPENAPGPIQGRWFLDFDRDGGKAQITMKRSSSRGNWTNSHTVSLSEFRGLSRPSGSADVAAQFALARDAGTVSFEGQLDATGGSGRFSFAPAPGFAAAMAREGVGELSDEQVFSAAILDVSRQFLGELKALGYDRLRFDSLLSMRIHGAGPEFIRELKSLGYDGLSSDQLVSMRIHGATPAFIREMQALGYDRLSSDSLVSMRIHGATPEYVKDLKDLGYERIPADQLVAMRIHGVTPDYVRGLAELGYKNVPVDELVAMRIHGVSLEFVKKMQALDPRVSPDELVNERIHSRR